MKCSATISLLILCAASFSQAAPLQQPFSAKDLLIDIDVQALKSFLSFCQMNEEFCKEGGSMEHRLTVELFTNQLGWYGVLQMNIYLRDCLDQPETCNLKQTVISMDALLSKANDNQNSVLPGSVSGDSVKSLAGTELASFKPHHINSMYSRTGRRFGWMREYANVKPSKRSRRVKRNNSLSLSALLRGIVEGCEKLPCEPLTTPTSNIGVNNL